MRIIHYAGNDYVGPGIFLRVTKGTLTKLVQVCPHCEGDGEDRSRTPCYRCQGAGYVVQYVKATGQPDHDFRLPTPTPGPAE